MYMPQQAFCQGFSFSSLLFTLKSIHKFANWIFQSDGAKLLLLTLLWKNEMLTKRKKEQESVRRIAGKKEMKNELSSYKVNYNGGERVQHVILYSSYGTFKCTREYYTAFARRHISAYKRMRKCVWIELASIGIIIILLWSVNVAWNLY